MSATAAPDPTKDQATEFVRHDVGRLEYVDPRTLVVDPFNHRKARDGQAVRADARLIASVEIKGVETPLTVRLQEDGTTLGVVKGQRRLLAALALAEKAQKAGRPITEVPVLIRDDLVGADDEAVSSSMIENTHREQASTRDDLEALSLLSAMEITAAQRTRHAKALGYKPAELAAAAKVNAMDDQAMGQALQDFDLVEAAEYAEVAELGNAQWTLRQAKRRDQEATGKKGRGHWAHALETLRQQLADRQRRTELEAELRGNAVTLLDQRYSWTSTPARPLPDLRTPAGKKITSSQHAKTCVHHAAYIDRDTVKPVWMCADWQAAGHRLSDQAAAQVPEQAGQPSQAQKTADRNRVVANNKKWKTARTVRQQFLVELIARKTISDAAWVLVLDTITGTSNAYAKAVGRNRTDLLATLLQVADPNEGSGWKRAEHPFLPVIGRIGKARRGNILLAHVCAVFEQEAMGDRAWRTPATSGAPAWLEFLASEGYVPSELEAEVMAQGKPVADAQDEPEPVPAEDPDQADQQAADAEGEPEAPAEDVDHEAADAEHSADEPQEPDDDPADAEDSEDPHAGCTQPHTGPDGYVDCDGKPL
jgi:ParB family chromosome partitioning protein